MKIKLVSLGIICLLVLGGLFGLLIIKGETVSAKTYYVGGTGGSNYTKIQLAIDAASTGDSVYVYAGTYYENVYINKTISLVGAGRGNTTIDAFGLKNGITINADWVNISGFTIKNGGDVVYAGIYLNSVKFCSITDNNVSSNKFYGIYLSGASNNRLENNIISFNNCTGLAIRVGSSNNQIINNIIKNNCAKYTGSDRGEIYIHLFSNNNTLSRNTISNNANYGIIIYSSNYNIIKLNIISNINKYSVYFVTSNFYNIIYYNDFLNNNQHINGGGSLNFLNSTHKISYFYNNTNFTSQLGNYWDDYTGNDIDGDGIGETAYSPSSKDNFPLIKPKANYLIIPSSIEADLNATYFRTKNTTVKIVAQNATINSTLSGDLNGTINFTNLEFVTIDSGRFKGKGFFTANWTASIESLPYQGTWQGMLYDVSSTKTINLKGTLFGGLQGITDGYLIESIKNSGLYDLINSSVTINQLGIYVLFAQSKLNGTVSYQTQVNSTSEIYILQALFSGNCSGYYNQSLSVTLTHVRINNATHPYYGFGFSIMSYVSKWGSGLGWTYDETTKPNVVSMTGFFTKPLWGIVFGTLDETGTTPKLSLTIIRLEVGLPPKPILDLKIWGPYIISPGMKFHYFMRFRNTGHVSVRNTDIIMALPRICTFINNTGNGTYNSTIHQVTWRQDIMAKSSTLVSVKVNISYGLKKGTKLYCNGSIRDYVQNKTLLSYSYKRALSTAKDPNVKSGPEGYVVPGEKLNYRLEFENEGSGIAFGVYFTDTLSEYLDDSTLKIDKVISTNDSSVIGPKGIYDPGTRTITWFVGELGPKEGGYANFSINVHKTAAPGTAILNYGTVYFPSVPEVTKTNGVVSMVRLNTNPVANAGSDLVVNTLEEVQFDGSGSLDPDGSIVDYTWKFGDGKQGTGKTVAHTYLDDGNYNVKLTVTDNHGGKDTHEIVVQVLNRAPKGVLEVDISEVNTNEQVTFNADQSTDLDGTVSQYYFDFGDDSNSGWIGTPSVSHIYTDGPNSFTVSLTVKDDDGEVSINAAEVEISVQNVGPIPKLTSDKLEVFTYEEITLDAGLSTDSDGGIDDYLFEFGDGTDSGWITTSSVKHQYLDGPNEYTIKLTVKDDDGESGVAELMVKIKNRAPNAVAGDDRVVDTNQEIEFDGELSMDKDGKIRSYVWDFGDGSKDSGKAVTHAYVDNGEYTVTLKVTDDDGAVAKDTCIITVNNVKPQADFSFTPASGDVTTIFEFNPSVSDTDGTVTDYMWDFGDGTTSTLAKPNHQYQASGTYSVSLIAQDDDGHNSEIAEKEIVVSNLPPVAVAQSSTLVAFVGEKIEFDSSESYDYDGKIISFKWDFGDGTIVYGQGVTHSYQNIGTYIVTLYAKDPADATLDPDNDLLSNLVEYQNECDPDKKDTDGDGLSDFEEIYDHFTIPNNPDTDGDGYNDKIDAYPLDKDKFEKESVSKGSGIEIYLLILIVTIIIILIIIMMVVRKRNRTILGKPYNSDKRLKEIAYTILADPDNKNLYVSRDHIKDIVENSHNSGALSDEAYKQINEEILESDIPDSNNK
jgi:parallel beta-helix repeat protein